MQLYDLEHAAILPPSIVTDSPNKKQMILAELCQMAVSFTGTAHKKSPNKTKDHIN